jgi:hypothetical protein
MARKPSGSNLFKIYVRIGWEKVIKSIEGHIIIHVFKEMACLTTIVGIYSLFTYSIEKITNFFGTKDWFVTALEKNHRYIMLATIICWLLWRSKRYFETRINRKRTEINSLGKKKVIS